MIFAMTLTVDSSIVYPIPQMVSELAIHVKYSTYWPGKECDDGNYRGTR